MEQEYALWAKTFFDFSSLYTLSWGNLVFSKVFSSLSSEYNFFDLFSVLPIRNLNPAFSQNIRRFGARLPKKERVFFQVISLTFGMGNKKGWYPVFL